MGVLFMTYLWSMKITKENAEEGRDEGDIRKKISLSCHRHHRITSIDRRMKERWKGGKKKK